jgi:23S rRNA (cytidine1920-2'-O)/16S rRNA (cytidine1409-2'-O)-methyltransferase
MRADQLLVQRGLAPSRSAAQRLIEHGAVRWRSPAGWARPKKSGEDLDEGCEIEVTGQSTGGFTEVLLARGAASVTGIDVGHGQLHERLRADARVTALEGVNARHLDPAVLPRQQFELVVADLSFISLTLVLPALVPLATRDLLLLVKPQFELQPADVGKGGLVTDPVAHGHVAARMRAACAKRGLVLRDYFESTVAGGDGNREHFLWAQLP